MRSPRVATVGAGLLSLALAAGCTDGGSSQEAPPPAADASASAPAPSDAGEKPESVVDVTDQPGSREGYVGVLRDAEIEVCAVDGGALRVEGTVTNPEATVQSYRIYVSAMHGTDTRGLTQVDVAALDPEVTATWTAELDLADDDLTCLLRVERFEP